MKLFMIDMMSLMMPYMKHIMWAGIIAAILGIILYLMKKNNGALIAGRVVLGFAAFFFACWLAGMFLGMTPFVTIGGNPREFDFGTKVFYWMLGLGFLIPGWILWSFAHNKR